MFVEIPPIKYTNTGMTLYTWKIKKYSKVTIDTNISGIYVNLEEFVKILESNEVFVYIGSPTCSFGRRSIEPILDVLGDLGVDKFYYYDGGEGQEKTEKYEELMNYMVEKKIVRERENGKSFGMLLVLKVKNAEIVSTVRGSSYNLNENQSEYDILTENKEKMYIIDIMTI